jgi:uncharacterized protein (TIGR02246 family)
VLHERAGICCVAKQLHCQSFRRARFKFPLIPRGDVASVILGETPKQILLTRATLGRGGRAKRNSYQHMKKLLLLPVLFGLITPLTVRAADLHEEDAIIRQRHIEWCAAWNKHDPKLMAAFFIPDGDLINPFGRHARGTTEIEKLFTEEQTGAMAGTRYSGSVENIRYLGPNVAIVDVEGEVDGMKGPDGAAAPPFKHHVTWIAEKKGGKWMAHGARAFVFVPAAKPAK